MDSSSNVINLKTCLLMYRNNFVNDLNKINGLENRLHVIQMLKARLGQEAAMLSTFQPQPFLAITFLKGGLKFVEEEEAYLMKAMQTMKMPFANVDMAQNKKDAQEVGARGRCFANSSNHKKISNRIPAQAEGSRAGSNSSRNYSSSLYTQHLLMVKSSLLRHKQKMAARKKERANGSSSRGKGYAVEDIFRGYTNSQTVKSSLLRHKQKMMARKRERANGSSSRGKGRAVEDMFRYYTKSQTVEDIFRGYTISEMIPMIAAVVKLNMLARS